MTTCRCVLLRLSHPYTLRLSHLFALLKLETNPLRTLRLPPPGVP